MRNVIPLIGIAVVIIAVAGLLRWRSVRRRRRPSLPPLFFQLGNTNDTSRFDWQAANSWAARPVPTTSTNTTAVEPVIIRPSVAQESTANGNGVAGNIEPANATNGKTAARTEIVATNGLNNAAINVNTANPNSMNLATNNGAMSSHVVNGRAVGTSHVPPASVTRGTPPPPLITPTHLKVVRDEPGFANIHDVAPSETVRFRRPVDEAVQLLPGRLEVLSGDPRHQEIRFVRVPGRPAELILGREPGDSAQHVALRSSTVSRQHARFAYVDGQWQVVNLSNTNPVVVNGDELMSHDAARGLNDGDRIELGEVVLRFRSH